MVDTSHDPGFTPEDAREHQETFHNFGKVVLFSVLHVGLVLACLALAFLGNIPVLALLIGVAGTFAMIVAFVFGD